jgi:RNA polymerase sigma-70 factor (ECF subfamily)
MAEEAVLDLVAELTPQAEGPEVAGVASTVADRALGGDVEAWNALIARHNRRVIVSLLARGMSVERAKDIAQEAWLRLVEQQRAGRLTHISLPGLAIAQAAYLAFEAARKDATRIEMLAAGPEGVDYADPGADLETRIVSSERLARAERVLANCHRSAQVVFRLAYGEKPRSHVDIAREAGLSLQRVRQILCEVRKVLREALEEDDHA